MGETPGIKRDILGDTVKKRKARWLGKTENIPRKEEQEPKEGAGQGQ